MGRTTRKKEVVTGSRVGSNGCARLVWAVRNSLELSQEKFGNLLGVSFRSVSRWERAITEPTQDLQEMLERLDRVVKHLRSAMGPRAAHRWLLTPKKELDYRIPMDLVASDYATSQILEPLAQQEA